MSIIELVSTRAAKALVLVGAGEFPPRVQWSNRPEHGDIQINGALAAAKALRTNPRQLAQQLLDKLELDDVAAKLEIAGPGFINVSLRDDWVVKLLCQRAADPRLGVPVATQPQTVVVDYSSPNLAKEMHVGHLRSTIIGDAIVRVLEYLGHRVVRQNHIGDWGTQFGMLIAELEDQAGDSMEMELSDLEQFYRQSKAHFDADPAFADRARQYVVDLQAGDERCLTLWRRFIDISLSHAEQVYHTLNVSLTRDHVYGESAYNDALPGVVTELEAAGVAVEDAGAKVVFLNEFQDKDGNPSPVIVQKADGGYLYATTDLAAARYRAQALSANRCLYFIDARQSLHMQQIFLIARKMGWVGEGTELTHCAFGTMMGKDGKPFKSRSGDTVKLVALLDEAVSRAAELVREKNPDLDDLQVHEISQKVGIGAVKYADLCKTRTNDYIFDWDKMMAFEGNTAPYMQYAYTRVLSVFTKSGEDVDRFTAPIQLLDAAERKLALKLARFDETITQVANNTYPHELCTYLFECAGLYMSFYEQCPILKPEISVDTRNSRLALSALTAKTIKKGLDLLGIEVMRRM